MNEPSIMPGAETAPSKPKGNAWRTFGIVILTIIVTVTVGYLLLANYLFPDKFTPVVLSASEQQVLDKKLERAGIGSPGKRNSLKAEPYSEVGAGRDIHFTEKELNAMLANNTDLADKLAINLSDDLVSALLLVDLDPTFPVLGGKTVKLTAGMELGLTQGKPHAVLKGVSIWGVPLPNAWLGNMKNIDLMQEFGQAGGFWQAINEGVDQIEVEDGQLRIMLKE
jgi:hypothetical protein